MTSPLDAHTAPAAPRSRAPWTPQDSLELYRMEAWGKGYFGISDRGTVEVYPDKDSTRRIDLQALIEELGEREIHTPILLRLTDLLDHRMRELRAAFDAAIREGNYAGRYTCVYPIKVNQQRHICEEVRTLGSALGFGLEAGSKPELLAVLALTAGQNDMPIVCNGFKDHDFIETVMLATKLGRNIVPVVERARELELIVRYAEKLNVRPRIGMRAKLSSTGVGRWHHSAGVRSKFGLSSSEIVSGMEYLRERGLLDCLEMVHCHIGSQVFDIRNIKNAVTELTHIYCEMARAGAGMKTIDLGGGLGVDYDGSQSATESSINYSPQEYAADVVYRIGAVCDDAGVGHPDIITESGRALVAYSSLLVVDVLGSRSMDGAIDVDRIRELARSDDEVPQPLLDLLDAYDREPTSRLVEIYHDASHAVEESRSLFGLGYMSLPLRAACEELFWSIGFRLLQVCGDEIPEELVGLPALLSDIYFCNFSLFQSMPDSWGIDQLFPIVPIQRLDEEPTRRAVLADLTCDSDGKIEAFIDPLVEKATLELHPLIPVEKGDNGGREHQPYYLAIFLLGAYQEILGDLHNLFGDTHAVHVRLDEEGQPVIEEMVEGDTVSEVLGYVQFHPPDLRESMRRDVETAIRQRRLTVPEGRHLLRRFEQGLSSYTYLDAGPLED